MSEEYEKITLYSVDLGDLFNQVAEYGDKVVVRSAARLENDCWELDITIERV